MTSSAKITSNRANARASTGPKSKSGLMRSARNARRHGLSTPIDHDPIVSEEVDKLATEIAGRDATVEIKELARHVAEAQIDLRRVRLARYQLLSHGLSQPDPDQAKRRRPTKCLLTSLASLKPEIVMNAAPHLAQSSEASIAMVLQQKIKSLWAFDRYEKRALSRRKFAIRALDAARAASARHS